MTATWTTPQTWANSVLVDATQLNTHIRDNMDYLFTRPKTLSSVNAASDVSTTSTSFTDVDGAGTDLTLSVTTNGGRLLVGFTGSMSNGGGYRGYLDVDVDGTRLGLDDGVASFSATASATANVSFTAMTGVLSVGTHTVKLQWKTANVAGAVTCYMGAGTAAYDLHPQFWAIEV